MVIFLPFCYAKPHEPGYSKLWVQVFGCGNISYHTYGGAMEAARLSAAAKDLAEEQVEMILGSQPRPATATLEKTFLTELRAILTPFGARVSLTPNYGPVPVNPYSKTPWGNGR
ncbi:hypothetical protein [Chryseolinea lacunae]|uniref:Uncharacterized protein n=1 Tax=Chryseolinea lacunae TaxID=2801331 RepID=A0ABS1L2B6_9BACT|nr:hypothetical protein [Chryseolinea lacunae]MBL0745087.1 hypothetical protein [Chryseolinea lacunae]